MRTALTRLPNTPAAAFAGITACLSEWWSWGSCTAHHACEGWRPTRGD